MKAVRRVALAMLVPIVVAAGTMAWRYHARRLREDRLMHFHEHLPQPRTLADVVAALGPPDADTTSGDKRRLLYHTGTCVFWFAARSDGVIVEEGAGCQ